MRVGGIYFINHKTNDYFPEGAGLLNLSMSTWNNRAMIRNSFRVIIAHYNRQDYHRKQL